VLASPCAVTNSLFVNMPFGKEVTLDYSLIDKVSEILKVGKTARSYQPFNWIDDLHWVGKEESDRIVSQFFALGNSINFKYWWFEKNGNYQYTEGKKGGSMERGAFYMWRSLKLCLDNEIFPVLDARKLSKISLGEIKQIFADDDGKIPLPNLAERQRNWQDLGSKLLEYWDGEFYNLVHESHNSLIEFVRLSRQFRAFDDPLCKIPMVNSLMHQGRGITKFFETIFPGIDYQLLKQQLRIGILVPKSNLASKLIAKKLLTHVEARELRNAGLMSFLLIMEKSGLTGDIVDNIWWLNRRNCSDSDTKCDSCPFESMCEKKISLQIPLENTRYY
jgi:hypothetical protein